MLRNSKPETVRTTIREHLGKALKVAWFSDLYKREDKEEILEVAVDKVLDSSTLEVWDNGVIRLQDSKQEGKTLESWSKEEKEIAEYTTYYITEGLTEFINSMHQETAKWQLKTFTKLRDLEKEVVKIYKELGILPVIMRGSEFPPYRLYALQDNERIYTPLHDIHSYEEIHFEFDDREEIKSLINNTKGSSQE